MNDLKPCPFCGGEAHLASDYSSEKGQTFWQVYHFCSDGAAKGEFHGYGHKRHHLHRDGMADQEDAGNQRMEQEGGMSITDELREWMRVVLTDDDPAHAIADRIDEEHEREVRVQYYKGYNVGYDEGFASADDWLGQHEDAIAEHGWVRKDKEHIISHANIEVAPHVDWSRMADELDEFVEIVRGMAGGAE